MQSLMKLLVSALLIALAAPAAAQMPAPPERQAKPSQTDIAYAPAMPADSKGHLLDLYLPAGAAGPVPLVIWTSGSAFMGDNGKEGARYMAPELLAAGFAVAGVSVRSSSQTKFPGNLHDIKAAIRFLRANAAKYGIDRNRIAIMGDSSGGWTSAMAAVTGDVPGLEGRLGVTGVSSSVQAAVAFYPPTDFLEIDRWALVNCNPKAVFPPQFNFCHDGAKSPESLLVGCAIQTCKDKVRAADPARYISAKDPPLMILHGRADPLVPANQGERLYKALARGCVETVFYALPLAGHGPSWDFLQSPQVQRGATIERASRKGCATTNPQLEAPSWNAVIAFLKSSMGIAS